MEGIRVRGLSKRFGSVQALRGVSLDVAPGEIAALLGPNGAGKTTLIRILATTVLADEGSASVAGHDVAADPSGVRGSFGLVLGNERSWYWRLTARHNLEFFAALGGMGRREAARRAGELLEELQLTPYSERRVSDCSAGMRARLTLARALLREPPVLLLDEPSQSLDPVAAGGFRDTVSRLVTVRRTAVLVVTHDLTEVSQLGARPIVLSHGMLVSTAAESVDAGALERILSEPGR